MMIIEPRACDSNVLNWPGSKKHIPG